MNESDTRPHYFEVGPDARLRPFVRCYWGLRGPVPPVVERVLPDGCTEFIIHCGDAFVEHRAEGAHLQPRVLFVGPAERAICIQPGAYVDVIAVRFHPGGALLVDGPLSEYRGLVLPGHDSGIDLGHDIVDALSPLSDRARVRLLERRLLAALDRVPVDPAVRHARRRIAETHGAVRVEALARETSLTVRNLQRRFAHTVGLSPKGLARIVRIQHAIALARVGGATLAGIAAAAGYADQAHFNRQFRDVAGISPTGFFREQNRLDAFFAGE